MAIEKTSVKCGKKYDDIETLKVLCKKEAEQLLKAMEIPNGAKISIPFWTEDIPELICVGIFYKGENGEICYELDYTESTL